MGKKNEGFTLVELIVVMAIYSILLVLISTLIISVSRLNKSIFVNDEYDDTILIKNIIVELWSQNNGNIRFGNDNLFVIGEKIFFFKDNTFYYLEEDKIEILHNKEIININKIFDDKNVIFEIETKDSSIKFVLLNAEGNAYEK